MKFENFNIFICQSKKCLFDSQNQQPLRIMVIESLLLLLTPQYLSPLNICGGKTCLWLSFFLPFVRINSFASSIAAPAISTTSNSMCKLSRIIIILCWCVTIWNKRGKITCKHLHTSTASTKWLWKRYNRLPLTDKLVCNYGIIKKGFQNQFMNAVCTKLRW